MFSLTALAFFVAQVCAVHLVPFKDFVDSHKAGILGARDYQLGGPGVSDDGNGWGACYAACQPWEDFTESCSTTVHQVRPCTCSQEAISKQATCFACVSQNVIDAQTAINDAAASCAADGFQIATPAISRLSAPTPGGVAVSSSLTTVSARVTSTAVLPVVSSQSSSLGLSSATSSFQSTTDSTAFQSGTTSAQSDTTAPSTTTNGAVSVTGPSYALFVAAVTTALAFLRA